MTTFARFSESLDGTKSGPRQPAAPVIPSTSTLQPLGVSDVVLKSGFWADRQEVNSSATLGHILSWLEREGWLANFDLAAAGSDMSDRRGREFSDSEVYKYLEAVAWELGRKPDEALAATFDAVVRRVAAAQSADGYLSTRFGGKGQKSRYSDLEWGHELYCQGHLMQAGVARLRTGQYDDLLVTVAVRSAHHVCDTFGDPADKRVCGHAEIEVALAELGRATGEQRFVDQAARFVERRGHHSLADIEFGRAYYQDDVPVRDADVFRGHAVRANYLAAGAIDVAVETSDAALAQAVERQWKRTVARRTYITGGQGSRHQDEGFGEDFMLPPDRAYSETCASIASIMVSWRLLLQTGDVRHADLIERTLFNVVATSPGIGGTSFYYSNTLHQRSAGEPADPDVASARAESSLRAPWFDVSCCPPNLARTFAALASFFVTTDADGVQVHQYADMTVSSRMADGSTLRLAVQTSYPLEGRVVVKVIEAPDQPWTLQLRVPGWSMAASVTDARGEVRTVAPGTITLRGPAVGEQVSLDLDMAPRFVWPDDRIDAVRGTVAVERGPEVLALESCDLPDGLGPDHLSLVRVDTAQRPVDLGGRVVVRAVWSEGEPAAGLLVGRDSIERDWPYGDPAGREGHVCSADVALVPYHDWANRGPSTMRVWIPVL